MQSTGDFVHLLTHNISLASNLTREALYWSSDLVNFAAIPGLNSDLERLSRNIRAPHLKHTTPGNLA
jgi:hypothetical protein